MDPTELLVQHGPIGVLVAVVLLFTRQLFAGGIKITVHHDPAQMKELGEIIGNAAAQADALEALEGMATKNADDIADNRAAIATVTVRVEERTKRASSLAPKAAATT